MSDPNSGQKPSKRGVLWYVLLSIPAFLGWISVEQTAEQDARHPKATRIGKILGLVLVPLIFAGTAAFFWAKSAGYIDDFRVAIGQTGSLYDSVEGRACKSSLRGFQSASGDARSDVVFYDSGRTELVTQHTTEAGALAFEMVFDADSAATLDSDMQSAIRFAYLDWIPGEAEKSTGLLAQDSFWVNQPVDLGEASKILARDLSVVNLNSVQTRIGSVEINKGALWLSMPVILQRIGQNGAYEFSIRGRVPADKMADAIGVFSGANTAKAWLRVPVGDGAQLVSKREMKGADLGAAMRSAIDAMFARWSSGSMTAC